MSQNRLGNYAGNLLGTLVRMKEDTSMEALKIVFVAYSLGGLLVMRSGKISENTKSLIIYLRVLSSIFLIN